MKTIKTTFALLVAAISFAACTHESIEPMHPATQTQTVMKADTSATVIKEEYGDEPELPKRHKLPTETQPSYPIAPEPNYPTPINTPHPIGKPVMLADSLPL